MSTRGDFKQARNGCGCAAVIWFVVLTVIELPFEGWYAAVKANAPSGGGVLEALAIGLGVVVGVAWTVVAYRWLAKMGSPTYYEKRRWEQQEATRLRKKAWKEGKD